MFGIKSFLTTFLTFVLLQDLAEILYRAAAEGGYVDSSTVQEILGVSRDDDLPEGSPSKRRKIEGTIYCIR